MSSALSINHTIKLNSGNLIPSLGFGVYLVKGSQGETAIKQAVKSGYRHCMSMKYLQCRS
jgi:diketogulonate reductase-like aldo/keto reductase